MPDLISAWLIVSGVVAALVVLNAIAARIERWRGR